MPRSDSLKTDSPFLQIVYKYADELGIPRSVAASLIQQESGWEAQARAGATSAVGLGQLTKGVYEGEFGMTEQQAMEPENNIRASLQYLKRQIDQFDGDVELGLHAYHNGSGYTAKGQNSPAANPHFVSEVMARASSSPEAKALPLPRAHLPLLEMLQDPEYHHLKAQGKITPEFVRREYINRFIVPTAAYKKAKFSERAALVREIMALPDPKSGEPLAKWVETGAMNPTMMQRFLGGITPGKTAEDFTDQAGSGLGPQVAEGLRAGLGAGYAPGFLGALSPGQRAAFTASGGNEALLGLPKAILEAAYGEGAWPEARDTGEQIAAGGGALTGFIVGPAKVAKLESKLVSRFPGAGKVLERMVPKAGDKLAKAWAKVVAEQALHLGAAFRAAHLGDVLAQQTLQEAVQEGISAQGQGMLAGGVFGAVGSALPSQRVLQKLARVAIINTSMDAITGQRAWDERDAAQKVFDYGVNTFFGWKGHPLPRPAPLVPVRPQEAPAGEPSLGYTEAGMGGKPGPGLIFGRDVSGFRGQGRETSLARPGTPFRPAGEAPARMGLPAPSQRPQALAPAARSLPRPAPRPTRPEIGAPAASQRLALPGRRQRFTEHDPGVGAVESEVALPGGESAWVDAGFADIVQSLNEAGYPTRWSHSGLVRDHVGAPQRPRPGAPVAPIETAEGVRYGTSGEPYMAFDISGMEPERVQRLLDAAEASGFEAEKFADGQLGIYHTEHGGMTDTEIADTWQQFARRVAEPAPEPQPVGSVDAREALSAQAVDVGGKAEADLRQAEAAKPDLIVEEAPEGVQQSLWGDLKALAKEADSELSFLGTGPAFRLIAALDRAGRRQRMRMSGNWDRKVYEPIAERFRGSRATRGLARAYDPLAGLEGEPRRSYLSLRGELAGGRSRAERTGLRVNKAIDDIVKKNGDEAGRVAKAYLESRPGDPNLTSYEQQAHRVVESQPEIFGDLPKIKRLIHRMYVGGRARGLLSPEQDRLEWQYLPRILMSGTGRKDRYIRTLGTGKGLDLGWTRRRRRLTEKELLAKGTVDDAAYLASRAVIVEMSDILTSDFYNRLGDASLGLVDPTTVVSWRGRNIGPAHFEQMIGWARQELEAAKEEAKAGGAAGQMTPAGQGGAGSRVQRAQDLLTEMLLARDANKIRWEGKKYSLLDFSEMLEDAKRTLGATPDPATRARRQAVIDEMQQLYDQNAPEGYEPDQWKEIPSDERFGAGGGMVVHKGVYDDVVGQYNMMFGQHGFEGFSDFLVNMNRVFKRHATTMNPPGQIRNAVSNAILLDMAGTGVARQDELHGRVVREIKNNGRVWNAMRARGIEGASFTHAEAGRLDHLYWKLRGRKNAFWRAMSWYVDVAEWAGDRYQKTEMIFKMIRVLDRMDAWEIQNGRKARLLPKAEWDRLMDELVADAHKALFDYSLITPAVRTARNVPLGAPFISFQYFMTGRFVEQALRSPHRMLKWYLIPLLATPAMLALYDIGEEEYKAVEKLRADFLQEKGHAFMIPYRDDNGTWRTIDIGYFLPWGGLVEIAQKLSRGDIKGAAMDEIGAFGGPVPKILSAMSTGVDPYTGRKIIADEDEGRSWYWKAVTRTLYAMQMMMPPFMTEHGALADIMTAVREAAMDPAKLAEVQRSKKRMHRNVPEAAGRMLGVNVYEHNPLLDYEYRAMVLKARAKDLMNAARRENRPGGDEGARDFYVEQLQKLQVEMDELNALAEQAGLDRYERVFDQRMQER